MTTGCAKTFVALCWLCKVQVCVLTWQSLWPVLLVPSWSTSLSLLLSGLSYVVLLLVTTFLFPSICSLFLTCLWNLCQLSFVTSDTESLVTCCNFDVCIHCKIFMNRSPNVCPCELYRILVTYVWSQTAVWLWFAVRWGFSLVFSTRINSYVSALLIVLSPNTPVLQSCDIISACTAQDDSGSSTWTVIEKII